MTVLINLFGTSSSGKSTLMADLYSEMKLRNMSVELCPEWVKAWCWEGYHPNQYDQFFIIGNEIKQQSRLFGKVDYIVSDSPVLQSAFYKYLHSNVDNLTNTVMEFYRMAKEDGIITCNFLLQRNKPYEAFGRFQTELESDVIAEKLLKYLSNNNITYHSLAWKDRDRVKEVFKVLGIKW